MKIAVRLENEVQYNQFLGVVTLHVHYPNLLLLCHRPSGRWYEALKKMKGFTFVEFDDYAPPTPPDTYIVPANTLTLGRWIDLPKGEVVMEEGSLLFSDRDDVFPTQKIAHVMNIPDVDVKGVSENKTLYAQLIQDILPERIWNYYNEPVWGFSAPVFEKPLPVKKMDKKFRFHLLGLHHLPTSEEYMSCAFTQKNVKLAKMLLDLGHEVFLYGSEGSDAPCTELIQTHSLSDIRRSWGSGDNRFAIGYDWHKNQFRHDFNQEPAPATQLARATAIREINKRKRPDDFVLVTQGTHHKPIADAVGLQLVCEPGIGYRGSYAPFRAFESTYIQNFTYGSEHPRQGINGAFYDRVIPNYFDEKDFTISEEKGDYYLFMGRLIIRKGLDIAIKAVKALGGRLVVAGQISDETGNMIKDSVVEYIGYADAKKRAELMSKAKAVFTPSTYLEPFCGVHVEAMMSGAPVLTTNFGAFTDYVIDGVTGYKCNTLQDFVDGARLVEKLDPKIIKKYATKFTLDSVKWEYQRWFQDLYRVYESSIDTNKKAWHHLD